MYVARSLQSEDLKNLWTLVLLTQRSAAIFFRQKTCGSPENSSTSISLGTSPLPLSQKSRTFLHIFHTISYLRPFLLWALPKLFRSASILPTWASKKISSLPCSLQCWQLFCSTLGAI